MNEDVILLLLGANAGAYALATAFGEYGIPAVVMDECVPDAFSCSAFVSETWRVPGIAYRGILMRALGDFYAKHAGKTLLLIPTTAPFSERVEKDRAELEKMYILPRCNIGNGRELPVPQALLLTYTDSDGALYAHYATVVAACGNEPLAVIPAPPPEELLARAQGQTGISLYGVDAERELFLLSADGALSPFIAFPTAADASVVEWLLSDLVLCTPILVSEEVPEAVFALSPYRRLKPCVLPMEKERVACLARRRLYLSLYPYRGERRALRARLVLRRYLLGNWQKKTKIKK